MNKLAILIPGIGYTNDKPLLYYTSYLLRRRGYDIKKISFTGFPDGVFNDEKKMMQCFEIALNQTSKALEDIPFCDYMDVLFVSKSIGTSVAAFITSKENIPARHVFLTPLEKSLSFAKPGSGIAFTGTSDPWADYEEIKTACSKKKIPLTIIENANHSLETGDINFDLDTLRLILGRIEEYAGY